MAIKRADEIIWDPRPKCPQCGIMIVPSGNGQPYALNGNGNVYCREHGGMVEPEYDEVLKAYEERRSARRELLDIFSAKYGPPSEEEIAAVRKEWEKAQR